MIYGHQGDELWGTQLLQHKNNKQACHWLCIAIMMWIYHIIWTKHAWWMGKIKGPSGVPSYPCWGGCKVFGQDGSSSQHQHREKQQTSTLTLTTTVDLELLIILLLHLLWLWKENRIPREEPHRRAPSGKYVKQFQFQSSFICMAPYCNKFIWFTCKASLEQHLF